MMKKLVAAIVIISLWPVTGTSSEVDEHVSPPTASQVIEYSQSLAEISEEERRVAESNLQAWMNGTLEVPEGYADTQEPMSIGGATPKGRCEQNCNGRCCAGGSCVWSCLSYCLSGC